MKKKLLYLVPSYSSYKKPITNAFKRLGWQVKCFDYRKGDLLTRIYRFLPIIGGFEKASKFLESRLIQLNDKYEPELILTAKGEMLNKNLMKKIKKDFNKTVNLYPDYLNHWESIKEISKNFDFFFTFDKATVKKLKKIGRKNIRYLPQATEVENKINLKKKYAVTFIGTYNPWRVEYLSNLKDEGLNIWGDKRWFNTTLSGNTRGGRVSLQKMKQIIKKSKINLNIFFDDETKMEGVSLRPYEVTGSGGFLLTQYVKDYPNLYRIGKEIDWFKNPQEMLDKVKFYLKNDKLRQMIAKAGYRRTIKDHTYDTRIKQLLKIIGI